MEQEQHPLEPKNSSLLSAFTRKKEYHAPEIIDYGELRELTRTSNPIGDPRDTVTFESTAGLS